MPGVSGFLQPQNAGPTTVPSSHTAVLAGSPAQLSLSAHSGPTGKCAALSKAHGVPGSSRNSSEMVHRQMDLLNLDVLICVYFVMWMNGWTEEDSDRWEKMKKHPVCLDNPCRAVVPLEAAGTSFFMRMMQMTMEMA
ncbi:hypothetical protein HJG60_009545 [Phyllostomus discolor]|uniref:Uncharacterized protein n=1 Tax=Phyllostomus discolor TaxID=89673 RepID=A0A833YFE8_9CHIR|nr:hypothetical protein HJG60_009545 [Phyllostomus discolor]